MFEKEAKEYAERTKTEKELDVLNKVQAWGQESLDPDERRLLSGIQDREKARKQGFQKGAEFGYQKGLKAKVNTTTISDCPIKDSWHEQSTDDIYDFIAKDWSIKYFICIMKDKSLVTATGICDEDYSGDVSTYLDFDHDDEKYSSEDIVWWKEIELLEEK